MPRVFQTVELPRTSLRYYNLYDFGKIVYIFDSIDSVQVWRDGFDQDILARLRCMNFDPSLDFFAVSGIMIAANVTLATLVQEYGEVKTLMFDNVKRIYRVRRVGG